MKSRLIIFGAWFHGIDRLNAFLSGVAIIALAALTLLGAIGWIGPDPKPTLTTIPSPKEGGTINGGGTYNKGTQANVLATPNAGWLFTGWSGACSGTGPCEVNMDTDKAVAATFTPEQRITLTTIASPTEGGSVTGGSTYQEGDKANVLATPTLGWHFEGWSGACSGTGPCEVNMDTDKAVSATFKKDSGPDMFTLTTITSPPEGGSVTGGGSYVSGSQPTAQATPNPGWLFTGWAGDCSGTGACQPAMNANKTVTATFTPEPIDLEAEQGNGDGQAMPRSKASGASSILLKTGESRTLPTFNSLTSTNYSLLVMYSNDTTGSLETVTVTLDGATLGFFSAQDTGDFGEGWNNFVSSPPLETGLLQSGSHSIIVSVSGGDGLGAEIDVVTLNAN